jgi:glycosyltransferase involved in cell wall biosynthesis
VHEFASGIVVPPEDPAALAEACSTLLGDSEALARAVSGTAVAQDTLSWERAAEAHEKVYAELLSARG